MEASDGPFLFGEVSLADFMHTPTVFRLLRHWPYLSNWPRTRVWTQVIMEHPLVAEWIREAHCVSQVWCDDYLVPDLERSF